MQHYLTSPDIHGEKISFLWDNDLWLINEKGSPAVRLTSGLGIVTNSKFSPDGKYIAFRVEVGEDGSSADLYSLNLTDGTLARLTYLAGKSTSRRMYTDIAGWTPDGDLVVSTDAFRPFGAMTELYSISPAGGPLIPLNYGPASAIMFSGKTVFVARHANDMPHWKGYRGGTSGVIWKGEEGSEFKKIVDLGQHLSSPFLLSERVYFVSDIEGTGNLHSVDFNGSDLKKHTNFSEFYVRNAKTDGKGIVFQSGGKIFKHDPETGSTEGIEAVIISSPSSTAERFVPALKYQEDYCPDQTGDSLAVVSRGRGFVAPFRAGPVLESGTSSEHIRLPRLVSVDKFIYVSDREGEEDIYIEDLSTSSVVRIPVARGIIEELQVSDAVDKLLVANNRGDLFMIDVSKPSSPVIKDLDRSLAGAITGIALSADGEYAAYSFPELKQAIGRGPSNIIKVYSDKEGKSEPVTESGANDFSSVFSRDGNYLYFLSSRSLDPVSDSVVFDLSFPVTTVLSAIPMNQHASLKLDGIPPSLASHKDETHFPLGTLKEKQRVLQLKPGEYESISAIDGGVLVMEYPIEGMSKYYLFSKVARKGKLLKFDPFTGSIETVSDNVASHRVSGDGKVLLINDTDSNLLRKDLSGTGQQKELKFDFNRLKLRITPVLEWKQMFSEAKRLVRENYWNEDRMNEKFSKAFTKYDALLDAVSTRFELSDLLREFQGEFQTSHSYEIGGELTGIPAYQVGKLGVDLTFRDGKYVVERLLKANMSNDGEKSPAFLATIPLKEGDVIDAINGVHVDAENSPNRLLLNRADEIVSVRVQRGKETFTSYVKTMADDKRLRYREWVENNREYVHRKTDGKVGYIHIPDMGFNGFAEFTRLYPIESKRDALIVDVRYNGGGSVSQLLLEKLAKKRVAYDKPRRGEIEPYPAYSVNGPMVALSDENAGSDGDIFTHTFKLMNLGPVIGTRTWGGVVGIHPMHKLVDGSTVTQPQFAFWFKDVGYAVENYGTDPTIEIQNSPGNWRDGVDLQLEKGLEVIDEMMRGYSEGVEFKE